MSFSLSFCNFPRYILFATVPIIFVVLVCLCQHYLGRFREQRRRIVSECPTTVTEVELGHPPDESFTFRTTDACTEHRTTMRSESDSSIDIDAALDVHVLVNPAEDLGSLSEAQLHILREYCLI